MFSQFLFITGVFFGGLHPTITHVEIQVLKDITKKKKTCLAYSGTLNIKMGLNKRKISGNMTIKEKKNVQKDLSIGLVLSA